MVMTKPQMGTMKFKGRFPDLIETMAKICRNLMECLDKLLWVC